MDFLALHPFVRQTVIDKSRGVILGSALGDCIGLYTGTCGQAMGHQNMSLIEGRIPFQATV